MKTMGIARLSLAVLLAATLVGCASSPRRDGPGAGTATGAASGAVVGGALGNVLSADGRRSENTAIGAAVGATLGGGIGYAMDRQRADTHRQLDAERTRTEAELEQLRREIRALERERARQRVRDTAVEARHRSSQRRRARDEHEPLRVVVTPSGETRVAARR